MVRRSVWFAIGCLILVSIASPAGAATAATEAHAASASITQNTAATTTSTTNQNKAAASVAKSDASASSSPPSPAPEAPSRPWGERVRSAWSWVWELLAELAFKRWNSPVFEPAFWNSTMAGVRIVLPLGLGVLLVCNWLVQRAFGSVPKPLIDKTALGFVIAGFATYYGAFNPNIRNGGLYQVNAYYQEFFEAKYHAELDGAWLFDCTIAAEKQLGRTQQLAQRNVRSLTTPEELRVAGLTLGIEHPDQCTSRFSEARWTDFKADIAAFTKQVDPKVWSKLQSERRVVLSPTWLTVAPWLMPSVPSENAFRWSAVFQLAFHAATLAAVAVGFGFVPAAVTSVVWGCQPFMPFDAGVELFRSLWFEACICGMCALAKRRWALGTLALSFGVALQPLAILSVLAPAIVAARTWFSEHQGSYFPRAIAPALVLCTSAWLALGCVGSSYGRYTSALEFQASLPHPSDVGLGTLLTVDGPSRYEVLRQDALPDPARPWAKVRAQSLSETRALRWVVLASVAVALVALVWLRGTLWLSVAVGSIPCALAVQPVAECAGFLALALCTYRRNDLWPALLLATSGGAFLWGHAVFADDRAVISSALLLLTTLTLVIPLFPKLTRASRQAPAPVTAP